MDTLTIQWGPFPAIYDYGGRDLKASIVEYIRAMVRVVLDKAFRYEGPPPSAWHFVMHPKTWQRLSEIYACQAPDGETASVPIVLIELALAELRERQALPVDGVWYQVRVNSDASETDILFAGSEDSLARGAIEGLPAADDDHES